MAAATRARSQEVRNPLHPSQIDPATKFLYTPHTVTFLVVGETGTSELLRNSLSAASQPALQAEPPPHPQASRR